jgi:hypothetical protein
MAGLLLLVSLQRYDFIAVAMPAYILVFDSAIAFSIIRRRRRVRREP